MSKRSSRPTATARWVWAALTLFGVCSLQAAVEWDNTSAIVYAAPMQEVANVVFYLRNTGAQAVSIARVRPNCDCVSATAMRNEVAPGETGNIAVRFALGGRIGRQEKTVAVVLVDETERQVELRLIVEIPEPVAVTPRFVYWRVGEAAEFKVVTIALADDSARLGAITCADERFAVRLVSTSDARRWHALVKPIDTTSVRQAVVRLTAVVAGQQRVVVLYAAVK